VTIKSVGHGKVVIVHCHGPNKGKRIASSRKPMSRAKGRRMHAAIAISKKRRRKK